MANSISAICKHCKRELTPSHTSKCPYCEKTGKEVKVTVIDAIGLKAPASAGKIHTDMERGFIRMEVMRYNDLLELGSEAAVIKSGKQHIEGKTYEIQEGDVVVVLFNIG